MKRTIKILSLLGILALSVLAFPTSIVNNEPTYLVPVVFHVLENRNVRVADADILGVFETLKADFLAQNPDIILVPDDFKPLIGNPKIKFVLSDLTNDLSTTPGILRINTKIKVFKTNERKPFSESKIIEPDKYLNVYVCNLNDNKTGFVPSENNWKHDGVVIDYKKAKKQYRTITHETGHWFNLKHIFEKGCKDGDEVTDTPAQTMHTSNNCPIHPKIDCKKPAMFMNFMDYSTYRFFFTAGQVTKMRDYIKSKKKFEVEK